MYQVKKNNGNLIVKSIKVKILFLFVMFARNLCVFNAYKVIIITKINLRNLNNFFLMPIIFLKNLKELFDYMNKNLKNKQNKI